MHDLLKPPSIPARLLVPLAFVLIGISGCSGGGGGGGGPVINVPPVSSNSCNAIMDFDTAIVVPLSASDSNGNGTIASYTIDTLPTNGGINECATVPCTQQCATFSQCASFTYTPNFNSTGRRGMDKFTFHVTDSGGLSSSMATTWILNNGKVRIMPLGDSITLGLTQGNTNQPPAGSRVGYRKKLFGDLTAAGFPVDFVGSLSNGASAGLTDPDHEGHDGWCDDNNPNCTVVGGQNIASSVTNFLNTNPADNILLHIGTNHFDTSNAGVNTILNNISNWAQSNFPVSVFVARIIPAVDGTLGVNTFNNNIAAIATDRAAVKVYLVNQQDVLQLPGQLDKADPALMGAGDNLHPNQTGYDLMADKWKLDIQNATVPVLPTCQ